MGNSENQMRGGVIAGAILVALGGLLLLDNLHVVSVNIAGMFWPVIFIAWGAAALSRARGVQSLVLPVTALLAGLLMLLGEFDLIRHISLWSLWPLALIAAGVLTLASGGQWKGIANRFSPASTQTRLHETAIFSAVRRRIETPVFDGGELSSVFGGIEIDLRRASFMGEVVIEANAVFGGIELRIPEEWKVVMNGFAAFGAYEDKTLPPRPEPGVIPPVLTIRGNTAFGGVSVRN